MTDHEIISLLLWIIAVEAGLIAAGAFWLIFLV